ncbi:VirB2 family type IV secretion system major pilin TrwL [Bartonella sp. B10]
MKKFNTLKSKVNNGVIAAAVTVAMFFMARPVYAQVQKLTNAKTALDTVQSDLKEIFPIAAAVILLGLAIGYAGRFIEKGTFVRWSIGVIVAGSATALSELLFKAT